MASAARAQSAPAQSAPAAIGIGRTKPTSATLWAAAQSAPAPRRLTDSAVQAVMGLSSGLFARRSTGAGALWDARTASASASQPLGIQRAVLEEELRDANATGEERLDVYAEELQARQLEQGGAPGQSYVEHLAAQQEAARQAGNRLEKHGRPLVAPATVFLSHSWHDALSATDFLGAAVAAMQEGEYAWIDLYALSASPSDSGGPALRSWTLALPKRSSDPSLMARQIDEQFLHPMHDGDDWRKALAAQEACGCPECLALTDRRRESAEAATAAFHTMAGDGHAARLGELKRVVAVARAAHVEVHGGGGAGDAMAAEHEGIIASIGKVVAIVNPSRGGSSSGGSGGPAALGRLWWLFELLCAARVGAQLSFVLPSSHRERLHTALLQRRGSSIFGPLFAAAAAVDVERASAGSAEESAALLAHVKRTHRRGISGANLQLQELLREELGLGLLRDLIASSRAKLEQHTAANLISSRETNAFADGSRPAGADVEWSWAQEFGEIYDTQGNGYATLKEVANDWDEVEAAAWMRVRDCHDVGKVSLEEHLEYNRRHHKALEHAEFCAILSLFPSFCHFFHHFRHFFHHFRHFFHHFLSSQLS